METDTCSLIASFSVEREGVLDQTCDLSFFLVSLS